MQIGAIWIFLFSGRWASYSLWGGGFVGVVMGGAGGVKIGSAFLKKTGVGFGRTELSLRAIGTTFCALSSGHGPRGLGFQGGEEGVDFCIFGGAVLGGSKLETYFRKN